MRSNNSNVNAAAPVRGFMALCAVLAIGLASMASPAAAAPFAYVTNQGDNTVSVFDTNPPSVVATVPIPVGNGPIGAAVTPDGKHVYVTNVGNNTVSVIDTSTNTVVGTPIPVGSVPLGLAITPDGKHAYVANSADPGTVSVIATASNTVVATVPIPVGNGPGGVAVTPDGKRAYVASNGGFVSVIDTDTNTVFTTVEVGGGLQWVAVTPDGKHVYVTINFTDNVAVIATATNTVVGTPIPVGRAPAQIAVTPDGKHAYVANNSDPGTVSVIATISNTVVGTVSVGSFPVAVAITPDGKHVYVTNGFGSNNVSVIATATNTVVATVAVGSFPQGVAIVPPPPGIPFRTFNAKLVIQFGSVPNHDAFGLGSIFTLSSTASNGINPVTEAVTLQAGTFTTTIPPGSFIKNPDGSFTFAGVIGGVSLEVLIKPAGTLRYAFRAKATGPDLTGTKNAVYATMTIGDDSGATSVNASISP